MSKKQYFYIYKTTNLLNNKFYIGMHCTSNLDDGYLGSGKRLRYSIRKYGKLNFKREILEFCTNKESLAKREAEIVNSALINEDLCMNLRTGGFGGFINEEHREKFLESAKLVTFKNSEIQQKCRTKLKWLWENDKEWAERLGKKFSESSKGNKSFLGKTHSEETKLKMSLSNTHQKGQKNSQFGSCWIYNLDLKENKKIEKSELQNYLNQNWFKGRKLNFK